MPIIPLAFTKIEPQTAPVPLTNGSKSVTRLLGIATLVVAVGIAPFKHQLDDVNQSVLVEPIQLFAIIIVTSLLSVASVQPLLVAVRVRVTVPEVISPALGIYVAARVVLFGENVPVPDVLQLKPLLLVADAPVMVPPL